MHLKLNEADSFTTKKTTTVLWCCKTWEIQVEIYSESKTEAQKSLTGIFQETIHPQTFKLQKKKISERILNFIQTDYDDPDLQLLKIFK